MLERETERERYIYIHSNTHYHIGILVFRSLQNWKNLGTTSHHNGDVGVAALSFAHLDLSTAFHDKFAAVLFDIRQLIFNPDGAGDSGISCRYMHGYIYIYMYI